MRFARRLRLNLYRKIPERHWRTSCSYRSRADDLWTLPEIMFNGQTVGGSFRLEHRTILLVDDEPAFLELALRTAARNFPIELVAVIGSGIDALDAVQKYRPDLVIMDLDMPGIDGLHATSWIKSQPGAPKIFIVTGFDMPDVRAAARVAGADGFCGKVGLAQSLAPLFSALWPDFFHHAHAQPA